MVLGEENKMNKEEENAVVARQRKRTPAVAAVRKKRTPAGVARQGRTVVEEDGRNGGWSPGLVRDKEAEGGTAGGRRGDAGGGVVGGGVVGIVDDGGGLIGIKMVNALKKALIFDVLVRDISLLLCSLVESIRLTLICTLYAGLLVRGRLVGCLPCIGASKFREVPIIIDYFRLIRYCDIMVAHWITGRGRMLLKSWLQLSNIGAESSLTVMLLIWEGLGLRGGAATGEWARPRYIEFGWSLLAVPKKLLMRKIKSWIMENICSIN
ncbi:hypothetical protein KSS87_004380 [Heliosperma pusillum]|nr:hypothetical protein KSS87_004380 [Heliosperma pusillum]